MSQIALEHEPAATGHEMPRHFVRSLPATQKFMTAPHEYFLQLMHEYGDAVSVHGLIPIKRILPFHLLSHPDFVKHILQTSHRKYGHNTIDFKFLRVMTGQGLLTSDGPLWLRQRRLMTPFFDQSHINAFGRQMTRTAQAMAEQWEPIARENRAVDIVDEMTRLTFEIIGKTLFGADISQHAETLLRVNHITNIRPTSWRGLLATIRWLPMPSTLKYKAAVRLYDNIVHGIIDARRQSSDDHDDLLSLLLEARDVDTNEPMSDQQLRDEMMTLMQAGHETTADNLSWTWYLLSKHPIVERQLDEELAQVLGGRLPTVEDLPKLPYTRMVLMESMRLYPPVWGITRLAAEDDEIGGYAIAKDAYIGVVPYVVHRHPDFWKNPEGFDPERFAPAACAERHPFAYFPFGAGPRKCIGHNFAMCEAQLVLATLAQQYRIDMVPGHPVDTDPRITLRPKYGLMATLHRKKGR